MLCRQLLDRFFCFSGQGESETVLLEYRIHELICKKDIEESQWITTKVIDLRQKPIVKDSETDIVMNGFFNEFDCCLKYILISSVKPGCPFVYYLNPHFFDEQLIPTNFFRIYFSDRVII